MKKDSLKRCRLAVLIAVPLSSGLFAAAPPDLKPVRIAAPINGHIHPAVCVSQEGTIVVTYGRVNHRDLRTEAPAEAIDELRGQRDLRHEHQARGAVGVLEAATLGAFDDQAVDACIDRMAGRRLTEPGKPDDLTVLAFRLNAGEADAELD